MDRDRDRLGWRDSKRDGGMVGKTEIGMEGGEREWLMRSEVHEENKDTDNKRGDTKNIEKTYIP